MRRFLGRVTCATTGRGLMRVRVAAESLAEAEEAVVATACLHLRCGVGEIRVPKLDELTPVAECEEVCA